MTEGKRNMRSLINDFYKKAIEGKTEIPAEDWEFYSDVYKEWYGMRPIKPEGLKLIREED